MMSGRELEGVFSILRFGRGDGGGIGLSIMADIDHNCMERCDSWGMCMASLLMCPGELTGAYGGMNGVQSLCAGLGLSRGLVTATWLTICILNVSCCKFNDYELKW